MNSDTAWKHLRYPTRNKKKAIYYGLCRGIGPIFIKALAACRLARIHWATRTARTWGEFAARVPASVMEELFDNGERKSFSQFCSGWMDQAVSWDEDQAVDWFLGALKSYRALDISERYPLPEEACTATDHMSDGDWPAWPSQLMLDWIPEEIVTKFGSVEGSLLNGSLLEIKDDNSLEIIAALLNDRGFECRRNDDLISLASGNSASDWTDAHMRELVENAEKELRD